MVEISGLLMLGGFVSSSVSLDAEVLWWSVCGMECGIY